MTEESESRNLSDTESAILARLLAADFPGRVELANQIANCRALDVDQCEISMLGSIELITSTPIPAPVVCSVPVEAAIRDVDGVVIHFMLHVVNGFVRELEISKEDFSEVISNPDLLSLPVQVNPE